LQSKANRITIIATQLDEKVKRQIMRGHQTTAKRGCPMYKCKYPSLFSPITLGGVTFRNRIFASPTGLQYSDPKNRPSAEGIAYYERKAMGGAASVCVGDATVDSEIALANGYHIPLDDAEAAPHLNKLSDAITKHGAVASVELCHGGNAARASYAAGHKIYGPSALDTTGGFGGAPVHADEMTRDIMDRTVKKHVEAALLAKRCGFGMITLHGGHGWLLHQFMSDITNKRTDAYGGSFDNKMRFPLEVIRAVRAAVGPKFPIEIRISGSEVFEGGYGIEYGAEIAKSLDGLVDLIHVSAGSHENFSVFTVTHPSMFLPDGVNVKYAAEIKKHVKQSKVATVGALSDPARMEDIIASGQADIVELARALICDPDLPIKARTGNGDKIVKCLRCFTCFSNLITHGHIVCALNPEIGNEAEVKFAQPPAVKKTVLVVGGGVAGMQAALTANERGHAVILCEKSDKLGGVLKCEDKVPFKAHLREYLEHQTRLISQTGIDVRLNTDVTPNLAAEIAPDVIIAALGSVPSVPPFVGANRANVHFAEDVYGNAERTNGSVLILGGGLVGTELAIYLAGLGKDVTVVETANEIGAGDNILQAQSISLELARLNIPVKFGTRAVEIAADGVIAETQGKRELLPADAVVIASGMSPRNEEANALRFIAPEFHQTGDCLAPKNIREATRTAYNIARDLGVKV
jgi:2,4-dienoyl-CoA reductase-like NADH-dependent reductase (Old Yellow Enzyme family)/NADPH-dependent 2,4-dienoyl-CoA reductase/sulfur reductase-like enzyme